MNRLIALAFALVVALSVFTSAHAADAPGNIRVTVWDERQEKQKEAYENYLGNAVADYLKKQPGLTVTSVGLNDKDQGLPKELLENTDVLVWWGHQKHTQVKAELTQAIVERIKSGKLSFVALHSAHWSEPFVLAMREVTIQQAKAKLTEEQLKTVKIETDNPTRHMTKEGDPLPGGELKKDKDGHDVLAIRLPVCCFPIVTNPGGKSVVTVLAPDHPIAKGLPASFEIPGTEVYAGTFHVPTPDVTLFEEKWSKGQKFQSGQVWTLGGGKIFYFRPGHETYPIYKQEFPLKIVENAIRFVAPSPGSAAK